MPLRVPAPLLTSFEMNRLQRRHARGRRARRPPAAARIVAVHAILETTANNFRVAKRLALRRGATLGERFGRLDDRLVFVLGSPRSGTTFLAGAIGSLPGFVDLGEVAPVKASIPELASLAPDEPGTTRNGEDPAQASGGLVGSERC